MSRQNVADHVDRRRAQWAEQLPDLDTAGMAILGRARWITLGVRPAIERAFNAEGLDAGEFDVLGTLLRSGPPYRLRPTELYRSLMISSAGMTDRLRRLMAAGLVTRPPAEGDGRSLLVELTPEGRGKAERAFRADMRIEADLLSGLDEDEQRQLADLLRKLALSLPRDHDEPAGID